MIVDPALADVDPLRRAVRDDIRADEIGIVARLVDEAALAPPALARVADRARWSRRFGARLFRDMVELPGLLGLGRTKRITR